ncbi:MAG: peptide/nickel transport system substrate-binding protein [Chloroflexota bacterium]|jgi:peptide/nickel transport system substrate-binding protein|nr:peptide/nickel transport system substrate-binding protein [Chloroflexota bacterium]
MALLGACAPASPKNSNSVAPSAAEAPPRLKSLTLASSNERPVLQSKLTGSIAAYQRWFWFANAYLAALDGSETPHPILAEEIPSFERHTWTARADGTMETIYKLRQSARWHDGAPVVARDFVFAWEVYLDPEFPAYDRSVERLISAIDTPDDHTLVIQWRGISIAADSIGRGSLEPIPSHLLEELYRTNHAAFVDPNAKQWSAEFIGAGPFRVDQWAPSEGRYVFAAFDGFALGRPKIDRLTISVIPDDNAILAAFLAGTVDVSFESINTDAALVLRDRWESQGKGKIVFNPGGLRLLSFQLRNLPGVDPALGDRRVRKALSLAIDREGLANLQPPGFTPAGYYMMSFTDRLYPTVERTIPKDTYDAPAAGRLLDDAGYRASPDGLRRNAAGDRLEVPLLTIPGLEDEGIAAVISGNWGQVGVDGGMAVIPQARRNDSELRATFPGAHSRSTNPNYLSPSVFDYTSSRIPSEANRWNGTNLGGYSSPETDRLAAAILGSLDVRERDRLTLEFVQQFSEDAAVLPTLFKSNFYVVARGISGYDLTLSQVQGSAFAWNIYDWTME